MKKILLILIGVLGIFFIGCKKEEKTNLEKNEMGKKIKIITTTFPIYDWIREISKGTKNIDLVLLNETGMDLHSFQPTTKDVLTLSKSDIIIYNGGISEEWLGEVLKETVNQNQKSLNLVKVLGDRVLVEEVTEGMQVDHSGHNHDEHHNHEGHKHNHDEHHNHEGHKHNHDEHHSHEGHKQHEEIDEHVWLSLKNAEIFVEEITALLISVDEENKNIYLKNKDEYIKKLKTLDEEIREKLEKNQNKIMIVGDRFPFIYLCNDYNISYFAAFNGCSAETEATFETIAFLSKKSDEVNTPYIIKLEGTLHKVAETIVRNTKSKNQEIIILDSMQSVNEEDIQKGKTYLSAMEENFKKLEKIFKNN